MIGLVTSWLVALVAVPCMCDYTVTIHPEYLSQNGRSHFESDRFDNHNGLDNPQYFSKNKAIGSESGRWMNRDLNGNIFRNTPEDHHRRGYADASHFNKVDLVGKYMDNIRAYGKDLDMVMVIRARGDWPNWMDKSHHQGQFPNNIDAAADMSANLVAAVSHQAGGIHPPFFEVMNEPDARYKFLSWDNAIEFHRLVAKKLKAKLHGIKVGGPTYTGAIAGADKNDFRVWKQLKQFMDMSLYNLDFFSFHPYNDLHSHGGSHSFNGPNEARVVALIDLIHSYSNQKRGFSVPLIISEFGLGGRDVDSHASTPFVQWAYAYQHIGYKFTFLNHRSAMERAVVFLLSHDQSGFEQASLFDHNNAETFVAKSFRFWHHFYYNQQFLRVESQYNGGERTVSPLAVADPHNKHVTVLLHNYKKSSETVKLNFNNNWISPSEGQSTCIYLENGHKPVFRENHNIHLNGGKLTISGETSCFYTFQTGHNFGGTPTFEEHVYYSKGQAYHIQGNTVQVTVTLPSSGNMHSAYLRIGVSNGNKHANTTPRSVHINGHQVNEHYALFDNDRYSSQTLWEVYNYHVPTNVLQHGGNTVKLQFNQNGGYVSSIALVAGKLNGNPSVVG